MTMRFGCQTYTWQMSYETYSNKLSHILNIARQAGFTGVEPEVCMLGPYHKYPKRLLDDLKDLDLTLGAIALALPWRNAHETDEEKEEAEHVLRYLKHFPEALLVLVQLPHEDRTDLQEKQKNALSCLNEVAKRASFHGITCAFHPNSPRGSAFRTKEDYDVMFEGLDIRYLGYAPDTGHIANGDMDPLDTIRISQSIVKHVHFKDISADKRWTAMGEGVIDHVSIVRYLKETNYAGWIMIEEESVEAELEPDRVTLQNGEYLKKHLLTV